MIVNANALNIPLASGSVHCVVTSPPYWALRDYGVTGQLGLEKTPEEYISNMVAVFREAWRVLRDDGTLWLNIGDSYANSPVGNKTPSGFSQNRAAVNTLAQFGDNRRGTMADSLKQKDLVGIPWLLAFALRADGWYLRSDIIWSKLNPMPESVTDRPTKAHEYIFLLTKSARYFYDAEAVREAATYGENLPSFRGSGSYTNNRSYDNSKIKSASTAGLDRPETTQRNLRSVWTMATQPYSGAHYATFPTTLAERCIKAGTSERGVCPKCGKGWGRVIESNSNWQERKKNGAGSGSLDVGHNTEHGAGMSHDLYANKTTTGWQPSCQHEAEPIPALVFDPFVGSGTTVQVAYDLGRRGVGLDLSLEYLDKQATTRIHKGHTGRLI